MTVRSLCPRARGFCDCSSRGIALVTGECCQLFKSFALPQRVYMEHGRGFVFVCFVYKL